MTIDVIVPIYNVELFLDRCVQSLLEQEYGDLHIILVDDGSTDLSGEMCDLYAKKDNRIQVIHKKNGGLSDARNAGLMESKSELVAFVDGDDFVHPMMYKKMVSAMEVSGADIVICDVFKIDEFNLNDISFGNVQKEESEITVVEKENILRQIKERDELTVVQWNKLFKRRALEGVRYPVGRKHEDIYVIHEQLFNCERIAYLGDKLYYYVQRSSSIMHTEDAKGIIDAIDGYIQRIEFFNEKGDCINIPWATNMLFEYIMWKYQTAVENRNSQLARVLVSKYRECFEKWFYLTEDLPYDYGILGKYPFLYFIIFKALLCRKKVICAMKN